VRPYLRAAIDAEVRRMARQIQAEAKQQTPTGRWPRSWLERARRPLRVPSERVDQPKEVEG
jgi:hypothetical protein